MPGTCLGGSDVMGAWKILTLALWLGLSGAGMAGMDVLRVGTSGDYPPFSRAGRGFDVDVAERLASDLGLQLEWVPFRWPELEKRLRAGEFDVAMSGVTWRPERDAFGWMSRVVAQAGPCLVGDPDPGRIAVNRGGVLERWARERFASAAIVAVDDNLSLPRLLAAGEVEAFATDRFEAPHFARDDWRVTCDPPRDRKVYWVAPHRAADLGPRIDAWLTANEKQVDALRARWLGGSAARDEVDHLVDLLARRLDWMPVVAGLKRGSGRSIEDADREKRVIGSVRDRATRAGLDPDRVEAFWRELIRIAKALQARHASPAGVLDLERDVRPALSRLDARIVEALAEAPAATVSVNDLAILDTRLRPDEIAALRVALHGVQSEGKGAASIGFFRSPDREMVPESGFHVLGDDDHFLKLSAGAFDIARISGERVNAGTRAGGQAELRFGRKLLWVAPLVGVLANSDGGVYGYAGGTFDFAWGRWTGGPLLSLGAYEQGSSKDLGGVFQFHVGASAAWRLRNGSRVGVTFAHLSNGFIHDENPGTEFLMLSWMLPLRPPAR